MITYKTRLITPNDALQMLEHNTGNRTLREAKIAQFTAFMKDGNFEATHQGIAFAKTGRLLDGQHRLHAIVRYGKPVEITVATGLEESVYKWIDGGSPRTAADRIHLVDDPRINRICCSLVNSYEVYAIGNKSGSVDLLEDRFLKMADAFLYVGRAFAKTIKLLTVMPVGAALVGFFHAHPGAADLVCYSYLTGENLGTKDPILLLRNAILAQRIHTQQEQYWKAISAFRAAGEGRELAGIVSAVRDFQGNSYDRLKWERSALSLKAAKTRKAGVKSKGEISEDPFA